MNRAMPYRAPTLMAFGLLLVASVAVWVRSYWRYDVVNVGDVQIASESGAVYFLSRLESFRHMSGRAGSNGLLEVEMGSPYMPWLPVRTRSYSADRFWVVQW